MSETTTPDPLNDWFRKIGTTLNNEDYEAGIQAIAAHDAEVAAKTLEDAVSYLATTSATLIGGRGGGAELLMARAAGIRGGR